MLHHNRRWHSIIFLALPGVILAGILQHNTPGQASQERLPMHVTSIKVDHVRVTTAKAFDPVARAFEKELGQFNPSVYAWLNAGQDVAKVRGKLEAMAGPSGFMLFRTSDHGALLRLVGQKMKALQYLLGNPLIAIEMTRHDIRAGLYAPLRVLIYEDDAGKTCLEYDRPSTVFGQFGNAKVTEVARMLDQKLEALVAKAIR